jgi:hypothetical protein
MHVTATVFGGIVICLSFFTKRYSLKIYYIFWAVIGIIYLANLFGDIAEFFNKRLSFILSMDMFREDFTNKMDYYAQNTQFHRLSSSISFKFVFYWLSCLLFFYKIKHSPLLITAKYLNVYLFGLFLFAVSSNILLIERVTDYFLLFSVCLFSFYLSDRKACGGAVNYYLALFTVIFVQMIFSLRIINREL